jgi:tetraacyldisaccharide 4'-kinase
MDWKKRLIDPVHQRLADLARGPSRAPLVSIQSIMACVSAVYGGVMVLRAQCYRNGILPSQQLPCRVVAIGNLSAGGTGKTPMTIYVARLIRELGLRVVVISRGYRSRMETVGGVVSDGSRVLVDVLDAGDEPFMMATALPGVPVIVGKDRHVSGQLAIRRFDPHVIILDDAFQHLKLKRDLDIVLLDGNRPLGNGYLLPRGFLREPPSALQRAGVIVYTRSQTGSAWSTDSERGKTIAPVFHAEHRSVIRMPAGKADPKEGSDIGMPAMLAGKKAVAFAGLADNGQFFDALTASGCVILRRYDFSDHHRYANAQIESIMADARNLNADFVLTTAKDAVKIKRNAEWPIPLLTVDVNIDFPGQATRFRQFLIRSLGLSRIDRTSHGHHGCVQTQDFE